jgi:hypothetical protein
MAAPAADVADATNLETVTKTATVTPSHGNGRILTGGQFGNNGGRPSNAFREACQRVAVETLPVIEEIAKGKLKRGNSLPAFSDSNAAWNNVARMGFGEPKVTVPEEIMEAVATVCAKYAGNGLDAAIVPNLLHDLFQLLK